MLGGTVNKKGFFDKVVSGIGTAVTNAANNLTGGLIGALLNDVDIIGLRNEWAGDGSVGKTTFLDYVARGNLLAEDGMGASSGPIKPQLVLDLSYYVQNAVVPALLTDGVEDIKTMVGSYPVSGMFVRPAQNSYQLTVINTKVPLIERVFYPWMREVTLPYWSYDEQPYTTANVEISFEKHADFRYLFVGSRPTQFEALTPTNDLPTPTRNITFTFDHMFVLSNLKTCESAKDRLKDAAKKLSGGVANTLGL